MRSTLLGHTRVLITAAILVAAGPGWAGAGASFSPYIADGAPMRVAQVGDTVRVAIGVQGLANVSSVSLQVRYNGAIFSYAGYVDAGLLGQGPTFASPPEVGADGMTSVTVETQIPTGANPVTASGSVGTLAFVATAPVPAAGEFLSLSQVRVLGGPTGGEPDSVTLADGTMGVEVTHAFVVVSTDPDSGATELPRKLSDIAVVFSGPLDPLTVTDRVILATNFGPVGYSWDYYDSTRTLVLHPDLPFLPTDQVWVNLLGTVTDTAGTSLSGSLRRAASGYAFSFRIGAHTPWLEITGVPTAPPAASDTVSIFYTPTDPDGDTLTPMDWQYSVGGGPWMAIPDSAITFAGNVASAQADSIQWDTRRGLDWMATDDVRVRFRISDGLYTSPFAVSGSFAVDNTRAPEVVDLRGPATEVGDDVPLSYTLAASAQALVTLEPEFTTDAGSTWQRASVLGDTIGVHPGIGNLTWRSAVDLPGFAGLVSFRLTPRDGVTGTGLATGAFPLDNNAPPSVVQVGPLPLAILDTVTVAYELADAEHDTLSIRCEFSVDSGVTWLPATVAGQTSGLTSYTGSVLWSCGADRPSASSMSGDFRVVPSDGDEGASEMAFFEWYNAPPSGPTVTQTRVTPSPTNGAGTVVVDATITMDAPPPAAKVLASHGLVTVEPGKGVQARGKLARIMAMTLTNAYLQLAVNDNATSWGPLGSFDLNTAAGQNLLFGDGGTTTAQVRIDGYSYRYGTAAGTYVQLPVQQGNSIVSVWKVGDIEVTQRVTIVNSASTGRDDAAWIQYSWRNVGSVSHDVGLYLVLDTMINANDAAPLSTSFGYSAIEREFLGAGNMPTYWQAFESSPSQGSGYLLAQGTLVGPGAVVPDRLVAGHWPGLYSVTWDYALDPTYYGDSAVGMWWNPQTLAPAASRSVATFYGLGLGALSAGQLSLNVTAPVQLTASHGVLTPNPFEVVALITNTGTETAMDVMANLVLPAGLTIAAGDSLHQAVSPATLPPGTVGQVSWRVHADSSSTATTYTYSVHVSSSTATVPSNDQYRSIGVPSAAATGVVGSAEVYLQTGAGVSLPTAMYAVDGVFDEPTEEVRATLDVSLLPPGPYPYSVVGYSDAGVAGDSSAGTLYVTVAPLGWTIGVDVIDETGETIALQLGLRESATGGIDTLYGEQELPPRPPDFGFDARWEPPALGGLTGLDRDFRASTAAADTIWWPLALQAETLNVPVTVSWANATLPGEGSFHLVDAASGGGTIDVDMRTTTQWQLATAGRIALAVRYAPPAGPTPLSCDYSLPWHWSMVSVPLATANPSRTALFANSVSMFGFAGTYVESAGFVPGSGYWLNMGQAEFTGTLQGQAFADSQLAVELPSHWSMVGSGMVPIDVPLLKTIFPNLVSVYGFDGGYRQAAVMQPGRAYWVNLSSPGTLDLSGRVAGVPPQKASAAPPVAVAGAALWAEGLGGAQVVELGVTSAQVAQLPPPPPAGLFDVRVLLGQGIESLQVPAGEGSWPIRLQGGVEQLRWRVPAGSAWELEVNGVVVPLAGQGQVAVAGLSQVILRQRSTLPQTTVLHTCYPNPFNPSTTLRYDLAQSADIRLRVHSVSGQLVREWVVASQAPGSYQVEWDGRDAAGLAVGNGVYLCELRAGDFRAVTRLMLVK